MLPLFTLVDLPIIHFKTYLRDPLEIALSLSGRRICQDQPLYLYRICSLFWSKYLWMYLCW